MGRIGIRVVPAGLGLAALLTIGTATAATETLSPAAQDALTYAEKIREGRALARDRKPAEAEARYLEALAIYDGDAALWQSLGNAYYALGRHDDATRAYERAIAVGLRFPSISAYNAACCRALAGDVDGAFAWLDRAVHELGFERWELLEDDTDLDVLREDPRWATLTHALAEKVSRTDGWRHDLEVFVAEVHRSHPDPFRVTPRETFEAAVASLRDRIPELSDEQIAVELRKLTVMLGDGHSGIRFSGGARVSLTFLPIDTYLFADGLFVTGEPAAHAGARVVQIGSMTVDALLERLPAYVPRDNDMGLLDHAPIVLRSPMLLADMGAIEPGTTAVPVVLEDRDGETHTITLEAVSPEGHLARHLRPSPLPDAPPAPRYLRRIGENLYFENLPDGVVYVQFNSVRNAEDETLAAIAGRLRARLTNGDVTDVIVDVRHNGGGNSFLFPPLVKALVAFDVEGEARGIYCITSRRTFSAAQNFITSLDTWTDTIFVGEPAGSRPNFPGESAGVMLPYSGLFAGVSSRYHQESDPKDFRGWIAPQLPVALDSKAYFANEDPALEAVMADIAARREKAATAG